jgi:transposase-like protein
MVFKSGRYLCLDCGVSSGCLVCPSCGSFNTVKVIIGQ